MSLMVWKYELGECFIANIGDSRIYRLDNSKVEQITVDDTIKRTKEIMTPAGRRVVDASSLNNVLGMDSPRIKIEQVDFKSNNCLVLASDGFFDARKSSFDKDMIEVATSNAMERAFLNVIEKYEFSTRDDMTAIVVKNNT